MKLPGINSKNVRRVLKKVVDLGQLISMSQVSFLTNKIPLSQRPSSKLFLRYRRNFTNC